MSTESPLIQSMRTAVAAAPTDVPLRLHLAELLLVEGLSEAAVAEAAVALQHAPGDMGARTLMMRAMGLPAPAAEQPEPTPEKPRAQEPAPEVPTAPAPPTGFDWAAAENEVADAVPPRFVTPGPTSTAPEAPLAADGGGYPGDATAWEVDTPGTVTLADVGGMEEIKERLEAAFLAPMRNPELGRLYGKSLRGGLLMYGPPGCGKTFIARAVAGELGASFMSVSINDVLDMWIGQLRAQHARGLRDRPPPGARACCSWTSWMRWEPSAAALQHSGMRNTVNQLLTELDGVGGAERGRVRARRDQRPLGRGHRAAHAPAGSTAPCSCCRRTRPRVRRSSATTCATGRSNPSTWANWSRSPRICRAPIWPTSANPRRNARCSTRPVPGRSG